MNTMPRRLPQPPAKRSTALPAVLMLAAALTLLVSCTFDLNYDKYAIVYGISDYATISDLTYTDDDARDMAALLTSQGFQVVSRITDNGSAPLFDTPQYEAHYDQLLTDFADAATIANLDQDDLFLFYFSGHGGQDLASSGTTENSPGTDRFDEIVALVNAAFDDEILLSDDELAGLLQAIPCVRKIIIIDACNSGGFIGNSLEADAIPPDFTPGSNSFLEIVGNAISLYNNFDTNGSDINPSDALMITASGERELSYELGDYENGVMTYFLLESATKGDRNGDNYITVSEAYHHIYNGINKNWNNSWNAMMSDVFFPRVSGGPVDYILFVKK
jgi:hypothetical protein